MNPNMKKLYFVTTLLILSIASCFAAPKNKLSFAIVTDDLTYSHCTEELNAYRDILISEGLNAGIIARDWTSPEEIRAELKAMRPNIEGAVFVGDVPIVMVRGAQFMTTAFKMNEKLYPEFESSVASDRFYDDFDLSFEFIKKDKENEGVFYYRLTADGSTQLNPDIYSARMKVPAVMKGDKYEILAKYLRKVVAAHQDSGNTLDHMTFFAGNAYNSDCLTIWRQRPLAFREEFPACFDKASGNRFLNFRENSEMKWRLFNELGRPGTDFFQFSEHGDPAIQYINGEKTYIQTAETIDALKRAIASYYKKYKGGPEDEAFCHEIIDSTYHIMRSEFSDSAMVEYARKDSLDQANSNITAEELCDVSTNAKIVILNACYNGSFHNPEGYIAGCHVFSDGACIVAQGNTVNVLQDKWEDKLIGLLSLGERVGMWQKEMCYLESHLIGDPTFRFSSLSAEDAKLCSALHKDLTKNGAKASVWAKYCQSDKALLRAVGIVHLSKLKNCSDLALEIFRNDESAMVRLHALNVLWNFADANATAAAIEALEDPMETIARTGISMIGAMSVYEAAPALEAYPERHPENIRSSYLSGNSLDILNGSKMLERDVTAISNKELDDSKRISSIRTFRNYRFIPAIEPLLSIVADNNASEELRVVACEALGWYDTSTGKKEIISGLERINTESPALKEEIAKSLKRLEKK